MKKEQEVFFEVNDYITLRLENGKTIIYVKGRLFNQCKRVVFNLPVNRLEELDEINPIDETIKTYRRSFPVSRIFITPEQEFWGYCSNLQTWVEHNYDTRLLHSNLAFPLLNRLSQAGDPQAKKVFKEEVARRLESGYLPVQLFLLNQGYLDFFTLDELQSLNIPHFMLLSRKNDSFFNSNNRHFLLLNRKNGKRFNSNKQNLFKRLKRNSDEFLRIKNNITKHKMLNTLNFISLFLNLNNKLTSNAVESYKNIVKENKVINHVSLIASCIFNATSKEIGNTSISIYEITKAFQHFGHRVLPKWILRDGRKFKMFLPAIKNTSHI